MKRRPLGDTGIPVSEHGWARCRSAPVSATSDVDDCVRTAHTALDAGINLVDGSDLYAAREAERVLRPRVPIPTADDPNRAFADDRRSIAPLTDPINHRPVVDERRQPTAGR